MPDNKESKERNEQAGLLQPSAKVLEADYGDRQNKRLLTRDEFDFIKEYIKQTDGKDKNGNPIRKISKNTLLTMPNDPKDKWPPRRLTYSIDIDKEGRLWAVYRGKKKAISRSGTGFVKDIQDIETGLWRIRKTLTKKPAYTLEYWNNLIEHEGEILEYLNRGRLEYVRETDKRDKQGVPLQKAVISDVRKEGESLFNLLPVIHENKQERLDVAIKIVEQFKTELWDKNVIHCDIKPENIIYNREGSGEIGIVDLEVAQRLDALHPKDKYIDPETGEVFFMSIQPSGTIEYMAPEVEQPGTLLKKALPGKKHYYSKKSDIYSVGKMFGFDLQLDETPGLSAARNQEVAHLINRMLAPNPSDRPSAEEVIGRLKAIKNDQDYKEANAPAHSPKLR